PGDGGKAEGPDPPPHVQDPDPGGHRRPGDRAGDAECLAEGRDGEMLRWRRDAEAEVAGKAEGREEEDAAVREGGDPAGGVYQRVEDGFLKGNLIVYGLFLYYF